ncbi:MAG: metabolite traffic protein EboE [Planctomycetes bacterium]|nr:metabolite traffic protein EboE [Planctomycetota bacterium]
MKIAHDQCRPQHLAYCQNVHAVESADEVLAAIERYFGPVVAGLKSRGHRGPFAAGLRLSARATREFEADGFLLDALGEALMRLDAHVSTVNAFPFGVFQTDGLKSDVYRPDWQDDERLHYTTLVGEILADLPCASSSQSVSTIPGSYRGFGTADETSMAARIAELALRFWTCGLTCERPLVLAIEPEPGCTWETTEEFIRFYNEVLLRGTWPALEASKPGNRALHEAILRQHVGICFDTCHAAVEFEDIRQSLGRLESEGIPVAKMQLSQALHLDEPQQNLEGLQRLAAFDEPRFLHQVVAQRRDGGLDRFPDLPHYLSCAAERDDLAARSHFHVPIFLDDLGGGLRTTQADLDQALQYARLRPITEHLEIETYSWSAMPERRAGPTRDEDLIGDILAEYDWALERLIKAP